MRKKNVLGLFTNLHTSLDHRHREWAKQYSDEYSLSYEGIESALERSRQSIQ